MITYVPLPQIRTAAYPKAQTENTSSTRTTIQGKRFLRKLNNNIILKVREEPISKFNLPGKVI